MKKLISMLLVLALVCCLLPATAFSEEATSETYPTDAIESLSESEAGIEAYAEADSVLYDEEDDVEEPLYCGKNVTWKLDEEGTLTISGTGPMTDYVDNVAPWYYVRRSIICVIIEEGVTTIGVQAFDSCANLTSVTIPDSVTTIGDSAFYWCYNLTSVTIPDSVTTIGDSAFCWCSSLTSVTIPDSVTTIGDSVFRDCSSLTSVTIPDSVTTIGDSAFSDCYDLTNVTIPDSVTTIGDSAFSDCYDLTNVTIPDSVTTIGDETFAWCSSLTSVTIPDSVTTIGDEAFCGCSSLTSVTIPDSVTTIGNSTFSECRSLTSVTIPDNVTTIGDEAFAWCSQLTSVTIPDSVTDISKYAFCDCSSLSSIHVSGGNPNYSSVDGVLFNKDQTELILAPGALSGAYTIPDSVTDIGDRAFSGCSKLTSITIPNGVTAIGDWAFFGCSKLTSVTLPGSVTDIGSSAFFWCDSLTGIHVSGDNPNYSSLDGVLFNKDLTKLILAPGALSGAYTVPDSVTTLGDEAFYSCTSLTSVTFQGDAPAAGNDVFGYELSAVYYPAGNESWTEDVKQSFGYGLTWIAYCSGHDFTDANGDYLCDICGASSILASGSCGEDLTWVLDDKLTLTIMGTGPMTNFDYGDTPWDSNIGVISTVIIEEGVTTIGERAFSDCSKLTSVTIPDSVTTIGDSAFSWCYALTSVSIPDSVTTIGDGAFYWCHGLTSVTIPGSVTDIGSSAFSWCASLTDIHVSGDNRNYSSVDGVLFNKDQTELIQYPCARSGAYSIPDGVTAIGTFAFYYCSNLTSVTIPSSVTTIGDEAFALCESLTSVVFAGDAPSFGDYVFNSKFSRWPVNAYYPADNGTWTEDVMQDYDGTLEWIPYEGEAPDINGTPNDILGDMTGDGVIDDNDVAHLLWHTLFPDAYEISGNADFNGDGVVDDADVAYLLWHTLFPENYPLVS